MSQIQDEHNRVDQANPVVDEDHGVTIIDQTPLETNDAINSNSTINDSVAQQSMPDNRWSLDQMVCRKTLFDNVTWPITAPSGTLLATYDLPTATFVTNLNTLPFERFVYSKFKYIKIHINVVGNRLLQGCIMVSFNPTQKSDAYISGSTNLASLQTLQNVHVHANQDTSAELMIPFVFYKDWLELRNSESIGQLQINVFNQYSGPVGAPTQLTIKLWSSIVGAEFHIPKSDAAPDLRRRRKNKQFESFELVPTMKKNIGFFAPLAANLLGNVLNTAIPKVVEKVGDKLDNPNIGMAPEPFTRKEQSYLSNAEGPEQLELLSLKPSTVQLVDSKHFSTEQNEMDLHFLLTNKLGFITTIPISTTSAIGDRLFDFKVGPNATLPWVNPGPQNVTPIDFWCSKFTFWRGSIDFVIEAVMSNFHECRIDVVFQPDVDDPTSWDDAITQFYTTIVLRSEQNTYRVRCPFFAAFPWRKIYWGNKRLTLDPANDTQAYSDYFGGLFTIYLSNPLIAPPSVADSIELNIYQVAGPDFEFGAPNFFGSSLAKVEGGISALEKSDKVKPTKGSRIPYMSKNSGVIPMNSDLSRNVTENKVNEQNAGAVTNFNINMPASSQPAIVFGNQPNPSIFDNDHFGERTMDLREILKRYTTVRRHKMQLPDDGDLVNAIENGDRPLINVINMNAPYEPSTIEGMEGFVSTNFRNARGPTCYKIRVSSRNNGGSSEELPPQTIHGWVSFIPGTIDINNNVDQWQKLGEQFPNTAIGTFDQAQPAGFFTNNQTAEIKVPWLHHTRTALLFKQYDVNSGNLGYYLNDYEGHRLVIAVYLRNAVKDTEIVVDIQRSFGDERIFGVYCGQPRVVYALEAYPDQPIEI